MIATEANQAGLVLRSRSSLLPITLGFLVAGSSLGHSQTYARILTSHVQEHLSGTGDLASYDVGDQILFQSNNYTDAFGTEFDIVAQVNAKNDPSTLVTGLSRVTGVDNWVEMTLSFVVPDSATTATPSGTPLPVVFHNLLVYDIDSNPGQDFTDVFGYNTTAGRDYSANTFLQNGGFKSSSNPPSGFKYSRLDDAAVGDPNDWTDEAQATGSFPNYDVRNAVSYDLGLTPISDVNYVWGSRGDSSLSNLNRGLVISLENTMVIPEPSTALLALCGFGFIARRKR
jgi:hypothetical protein